MKYDAVSPRIIWPLLFGQNKKRKIEKGKKEDGARFFVEEKKGSMVVIGNADVGINLVALDRFPARAYTRSNDRVTRQIIVNAYTHTRYTTTIRLTLSTFNRNSVYICINAKLNQNSGVCNFIRRVGCFRFDRLKRSWCLLRLNQEVVLRRKLVLPASIFRLYYRQPALNTLRKSISVR